MPDESSPQAQKRLELGPPKLPQSQAEPGMERVPRYAVGRVGEWTDRQTDRWARGGGFLFVGVMARPRLMTFPALYFQGSLEYISMLYPPPPHK